MGTRKSHSHWLALKVSKDNVVVHVSHKCRSFRKIPLLFLKLKVIFPKPHRKSGMHESLKHMLNLWNKLNCILHASFSMWLSFSSDSHVFSLYNSHITNLLHSPLSNESANLTIACNKYELAMSLVYMVILHTVYVKRDYTWQYILLWYRITWRSSLCIGWYIIWPIYNWWCRMVCCCKLLYQYPV